MIKRQWRSQAQKSGWALGTGDLGEGSPQWGPEAEPRWGSGGEALRSQVYTDSSQQSNAFLRRFVAESVLPPKNYSDQYRTAKSQEVDSRDIFAIAL